MAAQRYFCEAINAGRCDLSPEESHHAASVMRLGVGDTVELFDGRGTVAEASVTRVTRKSVTVDVARLTPPVPCPQPLLTLYCAVPKGPRQHVLVEKCTELGVSTLQPIISARSVVKPAASAIVRWRRYTIEAAKQARQTWLPEIHPAVSFAQSLQISPGGGTGRRTSHRLIATPEPEAALVGVALRNSPPLTHVAAWIGPEGGFAPAELEAALAAGLQPISLGQAVLRIETAALAIAAALRLW